MLIAKQLFVSNSGIIMTSINSFGSNLKTIRLAKKMSLEKLGKLSGFTRSYIFRIEKNLHQRPVYQTVKKLSDALNVTTDALLYGKEYKNFDNFDRVINFAPILTWDEIEDWLKQGDSMDFKRKLEKVALSSDKKKDCFIVKVEDDVMQSKGDITFNPSDSVVIEPCHDAENGKFVICKFAGCEKPILRQLIKEDGRIVLNVLNDKYGQNVFDDISKIEILGVVVERRIVL